MRTKSLLAVGLLALAAFNALGKGGTNMVVFAAASRGDVEQLQTLLAANTNLLSLRDDLLRAAALNGQKPAVDFLITKGANVNARGFFGMTPLADLAMYGTGDDEKCAAGAELLLADGAQVDPVDQYGGTPLLHAAEARKIQLMRVLLEHGANPANTNGMNGRSSLQFAMRNLDVDMIKLLLDFKAPIVGNADDDGRTPMLMWTISRHRYDVTRLLLEHGAVITPPQTIPGMQKNWARYWPLENANRERTPLLWAVFHRDTNLLALLVEFKAPLNAVDHNGRTPLHYFAEFGDLNMVTLLLNAGAEPNIADYEGATPLFLAEMAENKTMADLLLRSASGATLTGIPSTIPSRETMRAMAQNTCAGVGAAFDDLTNRMSVLFVTNRTNEATRRLIWDRWHAVSSVLGEEAGKGNTNAMLTLKKFLENKKLKYSALDPLGIAAAAGNPEALALLLHGHEQYGFLENSICFAMEPAAKSNQPPAVNYFVNLAVNTNSAQNQFYGVGWMIKQVLETATTNGNPQAREALDKFLVVYNH